MPKSIVEPNPDPGREAFHEADTVLLWLCGPDGKAEFFSPSWRTFTGRTLDALMGDGWYADVHRDHSPALAAAIENAIGKMQGFRIRLRIKHHNGDYHPFSCDGVVRMDRDGNFAGLVGVCTDITRLERNYAEAELAGRHFADLLPHTELITLAVDDAGRVLFFNPALPQLLGNLADESGKEHILGCFLDQDHRPLTDILFPQGGSAGLFPTRIETEYIEGQDGKRIFLWHPIPLQDYAGRLNGVILIGDDLTESRFAEEKLQLTARVFEIANLAMIITDPSGTIVSTNSAFTRLTGYSSEEVVGANPRILQSGRHDKVFYQTMWNSLLDRGSWQGEIWDRRKDGTVYPKSISIHALRNEQGEVTHYSGVFYDITERKAAEERLTWLAHFDSLTELPNRQFFRDELCLACHATTSGKERFALLYLDLDHFKNINDTMGHQAGDELLRETGRRLRSAIRSKDIAARIGGDEFAVLLKDVKDETNATMVAMKIIESFEQPVRISGKAVIASPSIGIVLCPDHASDPETLIRLADEAMYRAKATGRNAYCVFAE